MVADECPPRSERAGRRAHCDGCGRPSVGCWCACVRPVDNLTPLLILQDRDEAGQAKGTASLLARCLSRVELRIGERFDPPTSTAGLVLLYPAAPGNAATVESAPARHGEASHGNPLTGTPPLTTLVVLDGTWRRSRRLLHENPWLQALPRMALDAPPPSRYAIRRAHAASQRSTLEASALALAQLDGDESRYAPLWAAMDAFIALQQGLAERTPPVGGAGAR